MKSPRTSTLVAWLTAVALTVAAAGLVFPRFSAAVRNEGIKGRTAFYSADGASIRGFFEGLRPNPRLAQAVARLESGEAQGCKSRSSSFID